MRTSWTDVVCLDESPWRELIGRGAPFEMEPCGPRGTELFVRRPRRIAELLRQTAERHPDRVAHVFPDRTLTFAEVHDLAARVASALHDQLGLRPGDRVAVASANTLGYVLLVHANAMLGTVTVGLNAWWGVAELRDGLELSRPSVLFCDAPRHERLAGYSDSPVIPFGAAFDRLLSAQQLDPDRPVAGEHVEHEEDPYALLFTSGTTGRSKAAVLSHRAQIHRCLSAQLTAALHTSPSGPPATPVPTCSIHAGPMFHVSGLSSLWLAVANAGTLVHPPPGRWNESLYLELTERHRVTSWSPLVPTQVWRLLESPDLKTRDLSSVHSIAGGSTVWPPELLAALDAKVPHIRRGLALGYGTTETTGLGTTLGGVDTYDHPDAVGRPCVGVDIEIRDPAGGTPLEEGEVGEVCLRSGATFSGYWDNDDGTAAALDADGFYRTRDLGYVKEGLLHLVGRQSDMIIRGGENVYPIEIENRLLEHPLITDAAVVGVAHHQLGQEVKAVVVRADPALTEDDVRAWVAAELAAFKTPASVEFRESLPYNATGKVVKGELA